MSSNIPSDGFDPKKHPDGIFTFRRKPGCSYHAPREELIGDWPWLSPPSSRHRYSLTSLSVPDKCIGFARRRVGRGGRILLDRAYHPYSRQFEKLDLKKEHKHLPPTPELQDLLSEIKKNRWQHYEGGKKGPQAPNHNETKQRQSDSRLTQSPHVNFPSNLITTDTERPSHHGKANTAKHRKTTNRYVSKKSQVSTSVELSKTSAAFAMSALVTVATSTPVTATTNSTKHPRTAASVSQCKVLPSSSKAQGATMLKCVTCGGIISLTSTVSDSRTALSSATTTSTTHHRVGPLTLSLASSGQQSATQRTTVLPATVNVAMTRAGGGAHTTGVPALLRISSSGAVVGGTVLYPQPQATFIKTEDASSKQKKDVVSMSANQGSSQVRRTLTQRGSRGPVNVNLALPANVLASINSDSAVLRASNSAPNSPRAQQAQTIDGGGKTSQSSANPKTFSLNLSQLNTSQGSLFMTNTYATTGQVNQVVNAGRLTIAGNMLKLGNTLLHVALPPNTRQASASTSGAQTTASGENTLLVSDGNLILTAMDENKRKRTKSVLDQGNLKSELKATLTSSPTVKRPVTTVEDASANHTVLSSSTRTDPVVSSSSLEPMSAANSSSVKSSKSSRPMEVT